jgi:ubiquitin-conjugating enzyme E2 Q
MAVFVLQKNGWNPINDIESVIVSIRSLISEGRGRLEAAVKLEQTKYNELLDNAKSGNSTALNDDMHTKKRQLKSVDPYDEVVDTAKNKKTQDVHQEAPKRDDAGDAYSVDVAKTTFAKISELHDKEGWSKSWVKRG